MDGQPATTDRRHATASAANAEHELALAEQRRNALEGGLVQVNALLNHAAERGEREDGAPRTVRRALADDNAKLLRWFRRRWLCLWGPGHQPIASTMY
jgi:hypothetical protein